MGGGQFTYASDRGDKFSKLDRVLACNDFKSSWPLASLNVLKKGCSDHKLLFLNMVEVDFGHVPFRFFNSWLQLPGFCDFVASQCASFRSVGPADMSISTKLRWLKNRIKRWLKVKRKEETGVYEEKKKRLTELDGLAEQRTLLAEEVEERFECLNFIDEVDGCKQDLRQKARVKWASDADDNSSYFHGILNSNLSSNRLHRLMIGGVWNSSQVVIKEEVFNYFRARFTESAVVRPRFSCVESTSLNEEEARSLVEPFSLLEVKNAVWECCGDRLPGPNEFNFKFLKRCWLCFETDFMKMFDKFHANGRLSFAFFASFLALIPKAKDPINLGDYRPISLVGCLNKVVWC
ncbi:uncharacterized protein LOC143573866 [Bidens hawaiensis]|uniref:uncharacterized protein LOC143573866 n=1 Tax=Bidens hawaiensis TaxID=980011 RepID=UPI00404B24E8